MFQFIKKELLIYFRNEKLFIAVTFIPIALTLLFSGMFREKFINEIVIKETEVLQNIDMDGEFGKKTISFLQNVDVGSNLIITKGSKSKSDVKKISMKEEDIYLRLTAETDMIKLTPAKPKDDGDVNKNSTEGEKIQGEKTKNISEEMDESSYVLDIYINDLRDLRGRMVQSLVEAFTMRYKAIQSISKIDPQGVRNIDLESTKDYVLMKTVGPDVNPSALDYYSVAMLSFTALIGSFIAGVLIKEDSVKNSIRRIKESNLGPLKYFISKFTGSIFIVILEISIVYIFLKFVVGANLGNEDGAVFGVLSAFAVTGVFIGMFVASIIKSKVGFFVLNSIIVFVLSIFGGVVIPLSTLGDKPIFMNMERFTMIKGVNDGILSIIYSGNKIPANDSIRISLIVGSVIGLLTLIIITTSWPRKRGESIEKNLDSSEK